MVGSRELRKSPRRRERDGIVRTSWRQENQKLIRTGGFGFNDGQSRAIRAHEDLFTVAGRGLGRTNMQFGAQLPSDQSHVTLALRVFVWFKKPEVRGVVGGPPVALPGVLGQNGEIGNILGFFGAGGPGLGNAPATVQDAYRLYWQTLEQVHWSYGTGSKFSIENMPTWYFPAGGGLHGDMGGVSDLIHWNSGMPEHGSILRLARAILLPPRQNVKCSADLISLDDSGPNAAAAIAGLVAARGDMLDVVANLNALDGMGKVIQFVLDGLFARDVQ